jgi:sigma54-dependent transcription regulator
VNLPSPNYDGVAPDELLFLGTLDVNLLLIGLKGAARDRFEAGLMKGSISKWEPGRELVLPPTEGTGTLILHEVGSLTHRDQVRLLGWLEQSQGRTRVISMASASLFAQVEAGRFLDTLYYRLNTMTFDVR